jgi:hypothetical protein
MKVLRKAPAGISVAILVMSFVAGCGVVKANTGAPSRPGGKTGKVATSAAAMLPTGSIYMVTINGKRYLQVYMRVTQFKEAYPALTAWIY